MSDLTQKPSHLPDPKEYQGSGLPVLELALNAHYLDFQRYLMRRVGDKATAEDVLQSFCVRVMQSQTQLRDEASALGWLYTVLKSVLMDHFRKETVRKRGDARYSQEQLVLDGDDLAQESDDAICKCLRGFLEETRKNVADDMGVSQQNLRVRLHRARGAIGVALKQHCGACCETEYRDCFCENSCTDDSSHGNGAS